MSDEYCEACKHSLSKHYRDAKSIIRCMATYKGVSTKGVLGLPYQIECDCTNYTVTDNLVYYYEEELG